MDNAAISSLINKLNSAPGKTIIEGGYLYSFALIQRAGEKSDTPAIIRRPENGGYKDYEVVSYTPQVKL